MASKVVWTERYNCHMAKLPMGVVSVDWQGSNGGGYAVTVCGVRLAKVSADVEDGKARALRYAAYLATETLAMIGET